MTIEMQAFPVYYVFSSKGIQEYILRGNKLRWMIGGSNLVERLPVFFEELLSSLGFSKEEDYKVLSRAAGGVRMLFRSKEQALKVARVMPLALSLYAPGLDFVQATLPIEVNLAKTMEAAEKKLQQRRNRVFPVFPVAGPLVERCPRSGLPSVGILSIDGDSELLDSSMKTKERAFRDAKKGLAEKTLPEKYSDLGLLFPSSFEEFQDEKKYVGVVHIDGNGLGKVIIEFLQKTMGDPDEKVAKYYTELSKAIENATVSSVKKALEPIIERTIDEKREVLPFRPLVCAGDDLTIVLRAEDAFSFAVTFLQEFENATEMELRKVGADAGSSFLTACAGIAYVKDNYPFIQAYSLCESLCSYAKDETQRKSSALAFWRVTTTTASEFKDIRERELHYEDTTLTMMPYVTGKNAASAGFPTTESLQCLLEAIKRMPRGSVRGLLADLYESSDKAIRSLERLCDVAKQRGNEARAQEFLECLRNVTQNGNAGPLKADVLFTESNKKTPLLDAVELRSVEC